MLQGLIKFTSLKIMSSSFFNTGDQMIKEMFETVLNHAGDWASAKTTHLVCKIEGDDVPIVKTNDPKRYGNKHAEKLLIEDLERNNTVNETNGSSGADPDPLDDFENMSLYESEKKCNDKETNLPDLLNITVYINNSPCSDKIHNCTNELINFLDGYRGVKLNLYVTNLYNIRRDTCRNERHYKVVDEKVHRTTYAGLKNLMDHERCEIRAFTKEDWKDLFGIANVSQAVSDQLMDGYDDRSRKVEDTRIRSDLNYIDTH